MLANFRHNFNSTVAVRLSFSLQLTLRMATETVSAEMEMKRLLTVL